MGQALCRLRSRSTKRTRSEHSSLFNEVAESHMLDGPSLDELVLEPPSALEPSVASRKCVDKASSFIKGDRRPIQATAEQETERPSLAALRILNKPDPDEFDLAQLVTVSKEADQMSPVCIAVRIRPLNQKEAGEGSAECLRCEATTGVEVSSEKEKACRFVFDSVMGPDACQQDVFDRTGRPLLQKVLDGYNGCLFAYGQTGSGKTYTMHGPAQSPGIIPLLCKDLFEEIQKRRAAMTFTILCSILEIYNDKLKDLLVQDGDDLQIRMDSSPGGRGIFVDGVSEVPVHSCEDVSLLIDKGISRRMVGHTKMNEHSSRSHVVVTLHVACRNNDDAEGVTLTVSKLHLIDLAGSERQKSTLAEGERLRNGSQINLSLSCLGNVINALTERRSANQIPTAQGRRHVPYRESKLTRLLQDSLGGNAHTVMICNVSPSQSSMEETLSTLRFADRAKRIQNTVTVNRDPKNERILDLLKDKKALQAKVSRLEAHIARLERHYELL